MLTLEDGLAKQRLEAVFGEGDDRELVQYAEKYAKTYPEFALSVLTFASGLL